MPFVRVHKDKCVSCRVCELVCSLSHDGNFNPKNARLRVPITFPLPSAPKVCRQCPKPKCVDACPTGALTRDGNLVLYNEDLCTACGECIAACPFDAIFWNARQTGVSKCDLCGGDPWCVRLCPRQALAYQE